MLLVTLKMNRHQKLGIEVIIDLMFSHGHLITVTIYLYLVTIRALTVTKSWHLVTVRGIDRDQKLTFGHG